MHRLLALHCALLVACTKETSSGDPQRVDASDTPETSFNFVTDTSDASLADEPAVACAHDGSPFECALPPTSCADAVHALEYTSSQCLSGFCRWRVQTIDCTQYDGGICIDDGGAPGDAGWIQATPGCAIPAPPVPDPPSMACGPEAGAPADVECPLPSSVCAGLNAIAFYDKGTCVSGACTWQRHYQPCPAMCSKGACIYLGTR